MMGPLCLKKTSSTLSFRSAGSGKIENVGDINDDLNKALEKT